MDVPGFYPPCVGTLLAAGNGMLNKHYLDLWRCSYISLQSGLEVGNSRVFPQVNNFSLHPHSLYPSALPSRVGSLTLSGYLMATGWLLWLKMLTHCHNKSGRYQRAFFAESLSLRPPCESLLWIFPYEPLARTVHTPRQTSGKEKWIPHWLRIIMIRTQEGGALVLTSFSVIKKSLPISRKMDRCVCRVECEQRLPYPHMLLS